MASAQATRKVAQLQPRVVAVFACLVLSNFTLASTQQPRDHAMTSTPTPIQLTQAAELNDAFAAVIAPFWQNQVQHVRFDGVNNTANDLSVPRVSLFGGYVLHPAPKGSIVIASGRTEAALKYRELIYDLYQNGYSVFIMDHRGQGQSQRLTANPDQGYVTNFNDYVADLKTFYQGFVKPNTQHRPLLLAHSMGGAIAALYLAAHPEDFGRAVLSSPMFGIKAPISPGQARAIISGVEFVNGYLSRTPWYFFGQGDYQAHDFSENVVTHSKIRFQLQQRVLDEYPETRLGGVTHQWLGQAIDAMQSLSTRAAAIQIPVLVLQAGADKIVDNTAQQPVCDAMHNCRLQTIPQAEHELFIEQDRFRNPALQAALQFFAEAE